MHNGQYRTGQFGACGTCTFLRPSFDPLIIAWSSTVLSNPSNARKCMFVATGPGAHVCDVLVRPRRGERRRPAAFQTICLRHSFSNNLSKCPVPNAPATLLQHVPRLWLRVLLFPGDGSNAFQTICPKHSFPNNLSQSLIFKQFVPSTAFQTMCPRHRF